MAKVPGVRHPCSMTKHWCAASIILRLFAASLEETLVPHTRKCADSATKSAPPPMLGFDVYVAGAVAWRGEGGGCASAWCAMKRARGRIMVGM